MSVTAAFSPIKYYQDAKKMLEKKDLLEFIAKISIAVELSADNPEMIAKATFLKAKGLKVFNRNFKAVESVDEALKYNDGLKAFELREMQATAKGYLGRLNEAIEAYKTLLTETSESVTIARLCVSLAWAYLLLDRESPKEESLEETKKYLNMADKYFDVLPNFLKKKILNNFSVYYYYQNEFEKAITVLKEAFNYAEEKDLPRLYNNLAEIYLKFREKSGLKTSSIKDYLDKSETLAFKFDDKREIALSYYTRAELELLDEQVFKALDTLYLALDYFTEAEIYSYSLECLLKINKIINNMGEFLKRVKKAELLSNNYKDMFSKNKYLKSKGLFYSNRQKKLLESLSQRFDYDNVREMMDIKIYEGIFHGYYGMSDKAVDTFKSIINQTEDKSLITTAYLNIAWLYMDLDRRTLKGHQIDEAKKFLDLADQNFDFISNSLKSKVLSDYSIYYFLKEEYDQAIEVLVEAIKYCEEKDLADLYNTLVELYLKSTDDSSFSLDISKCLKEAEILGKKFNKTLSLGQTFYLRGEIELREDQFFTALDTLYLSFEYFKQAEATVLACECLLKINELIDGYKQKNLESLKNNMISGISNY